MLSEKLKNHRLILASGSPRRQQFFKDLGLEFTIDVRPIEEDFPEHLNHSEISDYLAALKTEPFKNTLQPKDILITSDTIVWNDGKALGKPKHFKDACDMIRSLSNTLHEVITSVCFTTTDRQTVVHSITKVHFKELSEEEITYYVETSEPYDKAGGYGIQEWIGYIGITSIEGSYNNVVGLPTHLVYETLNSMVD